MYTDFSISIYSIPQDTKKERLFSISFSILYTHCNYSEQQKNCIPAQKKF